MRRPYSGATSSCLRLSASKFGGTRPQKQIGGPCCDTADGFPVGVDGWDIAGTVDDTSGLPPVGSPATPGALSGSAGRWQMARRAELRADRSEDQQTWLCCGVATPAGESSDLLFSFRFTVSFPGPGAELKMAMPRDSAIIWRPGRAPHNHRFLAKKHGSEIILYRRNPALIGSFSAAASGNVTAIQASPPKIGLWTRTSICPCSRSWSWPPTGITTAHSIGRNSAARLATFLLRLFRPLQGPLLCAT
jgi:hypothetical protein